MSDANEAGGRQRQPTWFVAEIAPPEVSGKGKAELDRAMDRWLAEREHAAPTAWQRWQGSTRGKRAKGKNKCQQ